MIAREWVCAECGFAQEDSKPCHACGSIRVVLASVIVGLYGADWADAFEFDTERSCEIATAVVEAKSEHGRASDAAYDLLAFQGPPRHVAARIAEWLEEGGIGAAPDDGKDAYLTVRIRIRRATGTTGLPQGTEAPAKS